MAKFYGKIGYAETVENPDDPGVWTENIIEKFYYGDVTKNSKRYESGEKINDNVIISNSFSIIADAYLYDHFSNIRYIEWMGVKWNVNYVEVQRPRLILNAGGVYNGAGPEETP